MMRRQKRKRIKKESEIESGEKIPHTTLSGQYIGTMYETIHWYCSEFKNQLDLSLQSKTKKKH